MKNKVRIEIKVQENQPFWGGYRHQVFLVQIRTKLKKNGQNQVEVYHEEPPLVRYHLYVKGTRLKFIEPSKGRQNLEKLQRRDCKVIN